MDEDEDTFVEDVATTNEGTAMDTAMKGSGEGEREWCKNALPFPLSRVVRGAAEEVGGSGLRIQSGAIPSTAPSAAGALITTVPVVGPWLDSHQANDSVFDMPCAHRQCVCALRNSWKTHKVLEWV